MKYFFLVLFAFLLVCMAATTLSAVKSSPKGWKTYRGAWFEIAYPPRFKAQRSLPSLTALDGYDSAFFVSPDKKVEFYIFSPQWSGNPTDIKLNQKTEKLVSSRSQLIKRPIYNVRLVWQTIHAKNKRYTRSILDHFEGFNTVEKKNDIVMRWTFGFKYADQQSYHKYKSDYGKFKNSLEQYAD